jgi:hypothetical protein
LVYYQNMVIQPQQPKLPQSEWEHMKSQSSGIADATAVVLDVNRKRVKIQQAKIKDIAKGLAEIAYSMGETNNPEAFASIIAEDIMEGLKKVKKKQEKNRKHKRPNKDL